MNTHYHGIKYARKEPTIDNIIPQSLRGRGKYFDVVLYDDELAAKRYALYPWYGDKPRRGQKYARLNYATWRLEWID